MFRNGSGPRIRPVTTPAPGYLSVHQYEGRISWCCTKPSIQTDALIKLNVLIKISNCSKNHQENICVVVPELVPQSFISSTE